MVKQLAFGLQAPRRGVADGLLRAVELLGWAGLVLPELTLLGCRVVPVVLPDHDVHDARCAGGHGPQRDRDVLEIWEWPQAAGQVPATPLVLRGMLVQAGSWRPGLALARTWRGFGPAAVLTGPAGGCGAVGGCGALGGAADEICRLEFQLCGVGLVGLGAREPAVIVEPATGRQPPARRRVLDRWVEETLYEHALTSGTYP